MTNRFDFDQMIHREGTGSFKFDARQSLFGRDDIIPMWVADMDFAVPAAVTQALAERAKHPILGYTDFPDSLYDALIHWFKRRHDWNIERDWIIMSPGVVPSLHAASLAFANLGESIIVQPPVYHPFFSAVKNTGRTLIKNTLIFDDNRYTIDFEHLDQHAENARMLLLCSPHNPVGRVWEQHELQHILDIAQKHNLIVFSDEIHADLTYPEVEHQPIAKLAGNIDNIITAVAPSKTFNIAGLNLSALIVPNAAHRKSLHQAYETLHVSATNPFSIVAFEAAYKEGEAWLDALQAYLTETRSFVTDYFTKHLPQIKLIHPEGTYLLWLDCRELKMSDQELQQFFIQEAGLGLSPGKLFGEAGSGFMRMNIGTPKQVVKIALDKLAEALLKI